MSWGRSIVVAYVAFAVATLGFVAFAMTQRVELVSPDYYARSLQHDARLAAEANARALGRELQLASEDGRSVTVSLPSALAADARGTATLYRPSDSRADRVVSLRLDPHGRQRLSLDGLPHGRWLVQLEWTAGGRAYYYEQPIVAR